MWSRRFLLAGILTGSAAAALALVRISWALFLASGGGDPRWTPANAMTSGAIGVIIYPACRYFLVYRARDYSTLQTWCLIGVAYGVTCGLVIAVLFFGMFYPAGQLISQLSLAKPEAAWFALMALLAPFLIVIFALIASGIIGIAYVVIAAPIAFLHRFALLRMFSQR
jgi:hypothetical protein